MHMPLRRENKNIYCTSDTGGVPFRRSRRFRHRIIKKCTPQVSLSGVCRGWMRNCTTARYRNAKRYITYEMKQKRSS